MSITLTDLPHLVRQLKPHICTDDTLPVLGGLYLEATGTHLHALATDRYTFALARREAAETTGQPWRALLTLTDLAALRAVTPARQRTAEFTLTYIPGATLGGEDSRLTVSTGDRWLTIPANTPLADQYPKWRHVFAGALWAEPSQEQETHLSADYLARWTHATGGRYEPVTTWTTGPGKPVVFAAGHDFLGLQMPIRQDWDSSRPLRERSDRAALRTAWAGVLEHPASAPAAQPLKAA
ncbi:hypothetical protein ACFW1A_16020 [Kitasatospora sp. NPDC058965]|uniref:hypothetical protein n=1 Tax=Kitasatospora sp. NPDC058965 TaxID=3346682 RepID=UPI0036A45480